MVRRNSKVHYLVGSPFLMLTVIRYGRLIEIRWSLCISKSQRSLCFLFSWMDSGFCKYHLFVFSNLNRLLNSRWTLTITIIILPIENFSHQLTLIVFHRSLSDSKSPQVSRTFLSILTVLSNAVIWIVSTRPPTSKSSRPFNNPLVIVPKAPITSGTIVAFMFHSILGDLNNAAVWRVSARPVIF